MPVAAPRRQRAAAPPADDPATAYARGVLAGEIPAGRLVRLACERHLRDLERAGTEDFPWVFNPSIGDVFAEFCRLFKHYTGDRAGDAFRLEPFQAFFSYSILGWTDPETNLRRFRTAIVRVPRKNGKTFWAGAWGLYMLALDGEAGAQVYAAATRKEQARIVFRDACGMLKAAPRTVKSRFVEKVSVLEFPSRDSRLEPLSADSLTLDGLNPHAAICDETHAWPTRDLWDVIEDGMGARSQPLMLDISTAGSDTSCFGYENHKRAEDILERTTTDEQLFAYVAMADPEDVDNWDDPRVWFKANPGLGSVKMLGYMQQQAAYARARPTKLNTFLTKQLNLWVTAESRWLDPADWRKGESEDLREILKGKRCFGGLDLARVSDLTSLALWFPASETGLEKPAALVWHWCPEEDIQRRSRDDRVPYDVWLREGWISATPGNTTDFAFVRRDILSILGDYEMIDMAFDRFMAAETVQYLQGEGLEMVEFGQGFASMGAPTAEFERLVKAGQLLHEKSPVLSWEAGNVVVEMDPAGNIKPSKKKAREKIDGIVAAIMALGRQMAGGEEQTVPEVWSC